MPAWLAKGEGFAAIGVFLFLGIASLLCLHKIDGGQFVSAFQILVASYFSGGAISAFRDFKKGAAGGGG